jgi:hypothetical protein
MPPVPSVPFVSLTASQFPLLTACRKPPSVRLALTPDQWGAGFSAMSAVAMSPALRVHFLEAGEKPAPVTFRL